MPYPYEEDDEELLRRQRAELLARQGMGIPGAPADFGQAPRGFGQMPMPQDASRPPMAVQQQQSGGGGGNAGIVQGLGMAFGGLSQAQRQGQQIESGRTPPFVAPTPGARGAPGTFENPLPRDPNPQGKVQQMGARTPPFVAPTEQQAMQDPAYRNMRTHEGDGAVTAYHQKQRKEQQYVPAVVRFNAKGEPTDYEGNKLPTSFEPIPNYVPGTRGKIELLNQKQGQQPAPTPSPFDWRGGEPPPAPTPTPAPQSQRPRGPNSMGELIRSDIRGIGEAMTSHPTPEQQRPPATAWELLGVPPPSPTATPAPTPTPSPTPPPAQARGISPPPGLPGTEYQGPPSTPGERPTPPPAAQAQQPQRTAPRRQPARQGQAPVAAGEVTPPTKTPAQPAAAAAPELPSGQGGAQNYASPDIFKTPQERANENLQLQTRLQGTAGIPGGPLPQGALTPPPVQRDDTQRPRHAIDTQNAREAIQRGEPPPPPVGPPGARSRWETFGGQQTDKPWWQRGLVGAGLGAMAGSQYGIGGAIGGAVVGGGLSMGSPTYARNLGQNVIDVPRREMKEAKERRATAEAQESRKTEADIGYKEAQKKALETKTEWDQGEWERWEADQRNELARIGLTEKQINATIEHNKQQIRLGQYNAVTGRYGAINKTNPQDEDRRDNLAQAYADSHFDPAEKERMTRDATQSAYRAGGGAELDQKIQALSDRLKGQYAPAPSELEELKILQQQRSKLTEQTQTQGGADYKTQHARIKNGYRNILDKNGGQMPDFGKEHGYKAWTPEQVQHFANEVGMRPEDAQRIIVKYGGRVGGPDEAPAAAAPQGAPAQRPRATNYANPNAFNAPSAPPPQAQQRPQGRQKTNQEILDEMSRSGYLR